MVTVNLTSRCNQQCIYCEIGHHIPSPRQDDLSLDDLKWIIDEMHQNEIKRLALCGGEPFLFDSIIDVVAYAGKNNIQCAITTNGMTVHRLHDNELKVLKDYEAEINISIDSFDDKIQSCTRGINGSLEDIQKSIMILQEHQIPVTVLTVISKHNYQDLFKTLLTAYNKGIRQVLFQPIIFSSNYPDRPAIEKKAYLNVSPVQLNILMDELKKILHFERTHNINTNVYRIYPWIKHYLESAASLNGKWFFKDVLNKFYCREIDAIIDITYDGGIQPCGLALAKSTIHQDRNLGLMGQWAEATSELRDDNINGRYREYCNACCHHFSRNMMASIMKHPLHNRIALFQILSLILSRITAKAYKKVKFAK